MAPQMTPQMAARPMPIQKFGQQQFGQPYFQNHHFMQTPSIMMNSQDTNNMNLQMQSFKQTLDKQNDTINSLEEILLKVHREVNKLMAVPATPTEWKRNHIFIDQSHNQWTSRSDTVHFENHRTRISLASVDMVTSSNKKVRSWVINDSDLLRSMNLIVTGKVNHDQNFTTGSDITLISHRCDSNLKRSVKATILQQLRGLTDEKILIINDYNLDELNTSTLNVMKIMTIPMNSIGAYLLHLRIL